MAKSKAQVEKQKREAEQRKKTEKVILKLAADLPEIDPKTVVSPMSSKSQVKPKKA
jgi:hypothetical protein